MQMCGFGAPGKGPSPFWRLHMWFGWFYLLSPCAALLPLLPGGPARHCVPRPSAAWHSCPILGTGTHCTLVRAGCCCCCEPRPARPRRCCSLPPPPKPEPIPTLCGAEASPFPVASVEPVAPVCLPTFCAYRLAGFTVVIPVTLSHGSARWQRYGTLSAHGLSPLSWMD